MFFERKWSVRKKVFLLVSVFLALGLTAKAQTTPLSSWPVCRLGAAPIHPGPAPAEAVVFPAQGGPVVMSEAGLKGAVRFIRCRLPAGTPSYRGTDGVLRDVASNQPYWGVGWDAAPPPEPEPGRPG